MYPKWMYRKHPELGVFQSTLVATEEIAKELANGGWNEDPKSTGFKVRQATQMHPSHHVQGQPLHEVVTDAEGKPLEATIELKNKGDILK